MRAAALFVWLAAWIAPAAGAQTVADARDSVRAGRYESAITMLRRVRQSDSDAVAVQRLLARTLMTVGRYDEAQLVAQQVAQQVAQRASDARGGEALLTTLGEILETRGRYADAEAAYTRAVARSAPDSLRASVDRAVLHYKRGDHTRALRELDRFIDVYHTRRGKLTPDELMAVATACRYLGRRDPQLYKDALKALDEAIAADGDLLEAKVHAAELLLEKYNAADAESQLAEVLQANPSEPRALLAAAELAHFDQQNGADSLVSRALAVNPAFLEAHVFRASLLMEVEDYAAAERELGEALDVNPSSPAALATLAAARWLRGDSARLLDAQRRALAADPSGDELYDALADAAARVRRYREAADFARRGVLADTANGRAWMLLGMNELRLGEMSDGRRSLETAFRGDPYDVWVKNTLDLLDTFKGYAETRTAHFLFVVDTAESALLTPYLEQLGERAYRTFAAHYGYTPALPIRIEVYRSHADFSVRTIGLAGLGALGVSFGTTLAFDSPAAKDAGPFNWGSTVWHELAHTFTLGVSEHRVPRWLSEGLSVYEEHRGALGWGFNVSSGYLAAFQRGRLVPPSRLNDGLMRPRYPEQVQYSYYEASLVCDLIAQQWGDSALSRMLRAYREGLSTDDVFRRVLGEDAAAFDRRFDAYVRQRFAAPLAGLPVFAVRMAKARQAVAAGDDTAAIALSQAAKRAFPQDGGDDSPYRMLARIDMRRGDLRAAAAELTQLTALTETDDSALVMLSQVRERLGDVAGAAEALSRALYIDPYDPATHVKLAELAARAGDPAAALRERRAVLALHPVDRPEALYRLALAYRDAGDRANARHFVLRALEDAPNYADAQTLLLELHGVPPDTSFHTP